MKNNPRVSREPPWNPKSEAKMRKPFFPFFQVMSPRSGKETAAAPGVFTWFFVAFYGTRCTGLAKNTVTLAITDDDLSLPC
jgi:hypothetical protein